MECTIIEVTHLGLSVFSVFRQLPVHRESVITADTENTIYLHLLFIFLYNEYDIIIL